jgi:putative protease
MDQAVISYARQIGMEVHISTQINITNIETVKFYALLRILW